MEKKRIKREARKEKDAKITKQLLLCVLSVFFLGVLCV